MGSQRTRSSWRSKKRGKGFSMLIHEYFRSPEYSQLTAYELKALIDLYTQYRGSNNGDLCAAWSVMAPLGWRSKETLATAVRGLLEKGWIVITRQGGRRVATLYAVTWVGIDECNGKLDVKANPVPLMSWRTPSDKKIVLLPRLAGQSAPAHGAIEPPGADLCPAVRGNRGG